MAVDANRARVRLNDAIELVVNTFQHSACIQEHADLESGPKIHLQKTDPGGENLLEARVSKELFQGGC